MLMATVNKAYSTAMLTVGIIMLLSSLPPILMMDDGIPKGEKRPKWKCSYLGESFKQNGRTFKTAFKKENKYVALVLIDYFIMSIPIQALGNYVGGLITEYAGPYGVTKELWQTALIVYNAGVAVFSLIYGLISKFVSAKILVSIAYVLLTLVCIFSATWQLIPYDLDEKKGVNPGYAWLWTTVGVMSCCMGPIQALLRGLIGLLARPEQKNEVFGVLESMVILGSLIGSTAPGFLAKMGVWQFNVFEIAFFVAGFILFMCIPVMKAEKLAHERAQKAEEDTKLAAIDGAVVAGDSQNSKDGSSNVDDSSSSTSSSSPSASTSPAPSKDSRDFKSSSNPDPSKSSSDE
eukprot:gnl/Chilomastix_caulleri/291.p1 GENE.gnl/Chilomastix_caulleri/291~~gnl/Chilomastix_caulleri/291.p1  ORF type:complete len:389 (+),score=108.06 gnl/Chilomastix_caulleri/291:126-1169(+)